ncbi:PREDICTED: protein phosphatase 1 regulatory subunit 36-like [Dufourea novaeangliae]|uniref:Protein phosphatase 1 regulatory subunit 36 n=1 Tax=Dufourea novaeangliae TaxID=178035 RepID=A0A154PHA4_DUFNO|nr:PREDICTED: protein phosphatase 1 regulatory subunit 36-like [Dufourea novaeangliae]KZC11241.1 Protein phosphatase 1 regulatory subunit 36 [Dufourea novaeangliae]
MEDKHFGWDEISDGLILLGVQKTEDEQIKRHKGPTDPIPDSKVYCPHAYLMLNFHETLNQREKIRFRRHYLRKISPNEPNVIILQDIKDLVLYLLATPVSPQFIVFFHLPIVDRFLRATIIYFQYYIIIWEELMEERAATMKKAPNPLAQGYRSKYADDMQNLRCVLGREYADLIVGCQDSMQYHHMTGGKKGLASLIQSQGEKDLRMFEVLIGVTHRVVWIALQRKFFTLIEIELHRLFRSEAYNIAKRRTFSQLVSDMLEDDTAVLQGPKIQEKRRLLRNSPVIAELIYSTCDYRLLSLGMEDNTNGERIIYLQNALLIEEDKLHKLGIKIGILGENRDKYDLMLMPLEEEKPSDIQISDRATYEAMKSIKDASDLNKGTTIKKLPLFQTEFHVTSDFPIEVGNISPSGYETNCKEARKKWYMREMKRHYVRDTDTYSIMTN